MLVESIETKPLILSKPGFHSGSRQAWLLVSASLVSIVSYVAVKEILMVTLELAVKFAVFYFPQTFPGASRELAPTHPTPVLPRLQTWEVSHHHLLEKYRADW